MFKMKKYFLLLFCFISGFTFSQEYHFDYKCYDSETQLKGSYKGDNRTNLIYFNSKNPDIMAYDYFFLQPPRRSFLLYDYKLGVLNSYSIDLDSNLSSLNHVQHYPIKTYSDEIEIKKVDVEKISENKFLIKAFKTFQSKQSNLELEILVEKTSYSMPKIRFMDLTLNIHSKIYTALLSQLDSENYRIVDVITNYKNGVIMHDDLSKCEKINLKFLMEPNSTTNKSNK